MESTMVASATPLREQRLGWKVFGTLMAGALVGALGLQPYLHALLGPTLAAQGLPFVVVAVAGTLQSMVIAGLFSALGLGLGPKVGLGAPLLRAWLAGNETAPARFRALLRPSILLGIAGALAVAVLDLALFAPRLEVELAAATQTLPSPTPLQGFFASFYGGIVEELMLRLGLMTGLVWLGAKLTRRAGQPGAAVMWAAIVGTALLFGAGHLPAAATLMTLTPLVVARTLLLNGVLGIGFGWLYWRRDLLAAMVAHFSADIVLHVVLAWLLAGKR